MPYLILTIGLILATLGLYRFLRRAPPREIHLLMLSAAAVGVGVAALFLTLTGKLPMAIAILTALWPIGASYLRSRKTESPHLPQDRQEAFDILGLREGASKDDIRSAHMRLMKKVHPDQQGTDWLARKINAARDILLK